MTAWRKRRQASEYRSEEDFTCPRNRSSWRYLAMIWVARTEIAILGGLSKVL